MTNCLFNNKQHYDILKNITCEVPFTNLQIFDQGDVSNCCFTWLPTFIGNVLNTSLLDMIEGQTSKAIKDSVLDGSYSFCNAELCPKLSEVIHQKNLCHPLLDIQNKDKIPVKKLHIYMNYDRSCNLYCGSCRNEKILYTFENLPEKLQHIHHNVVTQLEDLERNGYDIILNVTGSGDPFASPLYWNFLKSIDLKKNYRLELSTNGTLMTPERMSLPFAQKIEFIGISVDAATKETYSKVRRGGQFNALIQNIEHLDNLVLNQKLPKLKSWRMNFVVQQENYLEMADFARWALTYKSISRIWFNLIADWGHLSKSEFNSKAIWQNDHPDYSRFLEILADPIFSDPKISLGNLAQYRNINTTL